MFLNDDVFQLCSLLNLEWCLHFEHIVQSHCNTRLLGATLEYELHQIPRKYRWWPMKKSNRIRPTLLVAFRESTRSRREATCSFEENYNSMNLSKSRFHSNDWDRSNEWEEPIARYRWASWVWWIICSSSRLFRKLRIILEVFRECTSN